MEILRQSMPWGTMSEQGSTSSPAAARRCTSTPCWPACTRGGQSLPDHLLRFTRAVTGAAFFAPSVDFLVAQGH